MSQIIKGTVLWVCAFVAAVLAVSFFSRSQAIEVQVPLVTKQMIEENQAQIQQEQQHRQNTLLAKRRAELEVRLYQCQSNEDCIIVDKDPCGCLKGPQGVTAINAGLSLEFSRLMEKTFSATTACPSVASVEKECAPTARPVCRFNRCQIVY